MIVASPRPDVIVPEVSLPSFVLGGAEGRADKAALIDGPSGRVLTYGEWAADVRRLAGALIDRGLERGEVFAIFLPNVPEYAVAFHGVAAAGGVVTTINPLYTADELAFQVKDADARWILTIPDFADRAIEAAGATGAEVFVLGAREGTTPFAQLVVGREIEPVAVDPRHDLVALPYSSGTTGFPKGVMLTHYNLVANICQAESALPVDDRDTLIGVLPFFHIYGMTVIMNCSLHRGATIVTVPRFDLVQFLSLMQEKQITRAYLVPPIILALAKHPMVDQYDLSSLEVIMSGAAPLGAELAEACAQRLGCYVMQGYGLTETSPVTHAVGDDGTPNKAGSIGPPVPNTQVMVADPESGSPLGPNETGEVWIRGPQVMRGYLNNATATEQTVDGEGWLHTGDIGYADEDGYFFLVDRLKELIKYKGFQVAPAEVEAVLVSHPAISDAAVVPVPDEEAGEIPKAFVVVSEPVTAEDVMEWVAERVAPHKRVRTVEFVDAIPKSASGKILRRVLKERAAPS